ncbi:hypothetical protein [Tamlana crocina]|uniref:Asp/Glu/hydantoin racemase n=1 Tax=Tamlana crocina TaxID=393006 RepID=A0ABX1DGK1_9FLAO|nr:hypothetical protein [Tamlana crocina]NJX15778.1 hypothetical protein [Tamlana crocina]
MIAFLHTSKNLVERFEKLVRKFDKDIEIKHFVNEALLKEALESGETDSNSFKKEVDEIRKHNPNLIVCTCSTYGELSEENGVLRIDEPIVRYIVENYGKVGLVYTANSTKTVSANLIIKLADELNKNVEIIYCDCSSYWSRFKSKDFVGYEKGIAEKIKSIVPKVDVVFLAQASMEGAKRYLDDIGIEVFSSPEFGIQEFLR